MKITHIAETKRGRFALFGEEDFLFSVDEETLYKNELYVGKLLSGQEVSLLLEQSDTRRAKDKALRYLSLRAYAEQELFEKLCLRHDEHSSSAAVQAMRELGLLNDLAFAEDRAKGLAARNKSTLEIRRHLIGLGVQRETVEAVMASQQRDDLAAALAVVRKLYLEKLRRGETQKVMAALARRGFSHAHIREAVDITMEELAEQEPNEQETV